MPATLIESNENGRIAYDSLVVSDPAVLSAFSNKLSLKIIKVLSENPSCALDVARKLKVHEQKVYYHLKNLEKTGIVYTVSTERRHGMIAKIYSVVSPVVAAKLFEKGSEIKGTTVPAVPSECLEFFSPFLKDGKLDVKIVIGSTKSHGRYESRAVDAPYLIDFLLFLGSFITSFDSSSPIYVFDTNVGEKELKNNIILVGNPKINSITDKINTILPIYFDPNNDFRIVSKLTNNKYPYDHDAVIIKTKNPFNPNKQLLLIAGKRSEGLRTAVLAIIKHTKEILDGNIRNKNLIAKVVSGLDKDSDGIIDSVKFCE